MKCFHKTLNYQYKKFAYNKNTTKLFSFEQNKEKIKRHFMLRYEFVEDMHYKRSKYFT